MSVQLQKGLSFPKGIINIISDYAHTLFYIDELKDKTKEIYNTIQSYPNFDLSYYYIGFLICNNRFTITSGLFTDTRHKLFDRENKRRVSFGMKENYSLWPGGCNKVYQSY